MDDNYARLIDELLSEFKTNFEYEPTDNEIFLMERIASLRHDVLRCLKLIAIHQNIIEKLVNHETPN